MVLHSTSENKCVLLWFKRPCIKDSLFNSPFFPVLPRRSNMFNNTSGFTVVSAEVNNIQGSHRRINSPTKVNYYNASSFLAHSAGHGTGNPSRYPSNPPQSSAPSMTQTHHRSGAGMFEGSTSFSIFTAELNNISGESLRESSATELSYDLGQVNTNGRHHHAARYDNSGFGSYDDPRSSPSVNYYGQPYGQNPGNYPPPPPQPMYGNNVYGAPQPYGNNDYRSPQSSIPGNHRGYGMSSSDRPAHPPRSSGVSRSSSDSPYANNVAPVHSRGSRQLPQSQTQQPQEPRHKKKNKGKEQRSRRYRDEGEEDSSSSDDEAKPEGSSDCNAAPDVLSPNSVAHKPNSN
ncbi:hypothetical protein MVEN_00225900 [Mycena venus]|uniref:Uncharacterized protein n=1 Tax=Mycena venus TaxID=2733690 RepID=A0A8H6YYT4_9AGAR|nr:hypothetical protein MVEN_00225900 [Mycena venus]